MMELLKNARGGWQDYNEDGKLMALFFAVLLFAWFWKKGTENKNIWLYATVMTVCCVCPLTAVALMAYQTKFYDYQWIWSAVPVIALTACGVVCFLAEWWSDSSRERRKNAPAVALSILVVMLLSGGLGRTEDEKAIWQEEQSKRQRAYRLTEELLLIAGEKEMASSDVQHQENAAAVGDIVLWAPADIMEYVREYSGEVKLLYGRNMWDKALNAYSYDVYSEEIVALYQQMELCADSGRVTQETAMGVETLYEDAAGGQSLSEQKIMVDCAIKAIGEGVNTVILPNSVDETMVQDLAKLWNTTPRAVEDYWIIYGQAD